MDSYGFAGRVAALAAVSDVGRIATFSAEGTLIIFTGLTADNLFVDDFIFT